MPLSVPVCCFGDIFRSQRCHTNLCVRVCGGGRESVGVYLQYVFSSWSVFVVLASIPVPTDTALADLAFILLKLL